jgi:multiple antibiotic resistance protein
MLSTAAVAAVFLMIFGGILTRLLHFSPEALAVAGGIILLIISISMVLSSGDAESRHHAIEGKDPMQLAVFPLAVPYLLNPVGIIVLVTLSAEAGTVARYALVIGLLAVVLTLDVVVFRWANRVSEHLDPSRMLLTEKVFGFLIAAIAVQFILQGLADLGVIHLVSH